MASGRHSGEAGRARTGGIPGAHPGTLPTELPLHVLPCRTDTGELFTLGGGAIENRRHMGRRVYATRLRDLGLLDRSALRRLYHIKLH